jgi:diguanylate cyclase (GGDEF)-like protein
VFEELRSKSNKDALTQLLNRRGLAEQAVPLVSNPSGFNACVLICDIDHFKQINDRFGHAVGDEVLEAVARIVSKAVRKTDIAARIGGEEFVIVLSYSTIREAFAFAERLRTAIANSSIPPLPPDRRVTVSIGIAAYDAAQTLWQAIDRADKLLYKAKQAGRNRTFAEGGYTSHLALIA